MKWYNSRTFWTLLSELIFNLLPILILVVIMLDSGQDFFSIRDLLFVAIIFYGQSLVKFVQGLTNIIGNPRIHFIALITTSIISFGLIPSCILLVKSFSDLKSLGCTSISFSYIEFFLSILIFFSVGFAGQYWQDKQIGDDDLE
jgi:uncharacterized membrane protein